MHIAKQRRIKLRYNGYFEKVPKTHIRLTATECSANKRVSTGFCLWSRSLRDSAIARWNASDSVASSALLRTRKITWVEKRRNSTIGQKWEDNHLKNGQLRTSRCIKTVTISRSKDQSNFSRKLGTLPDPVTTRSDKHACGKPMLTDPDKQATENREPADGMDKGDPTQDISWLVTALHSQSGGPGGACARTFLCKRELRFGRWCFKSGDTKTEAQYPYSLPQTPKEIHSASRKSMVTW